jgi:hypothetical protein
VTFPEAIGMIHTGAAYMTPKPAIHRPRPAGRDLAVAISLCLAVGCGRGATHHAFKDEGKVCVFPAGSGDPPLFIGTEPQAYEANRIVRIQVAAPVCLSSSCSHDRMAECTAVVDGNVITVSSTASFREEGNTCTTDCGTLAASCSTTPLAPGTHEIRHGTTTLNLMVPSMTPVPCGGKGVGGF